MTTKAVEAKYGIYRRLAAFDLGTDLSGEPPKLTLDRILDISGWARLAGLGKLKKLTAIECGTTTPVLAGNPIPVTELYLIENTLACLKSILAMTQA